MVTILDRVHESISFFNDGSNHYKEFVCVLSREEHMRSKQEIIDNTYLNNPCTFEFAPSKEAFIEDGFFSIASGGVTIHFKVGKFSYIGPVIPFK